MKMKNEDEKSEDIFYLAKIFQYIFFWNFELRWIQMCLQIFHILLRSKVIALQSKIKMGKTGKMDPLWRAVTFDRWNIWKIWIHIWNQRFSKFQKNIYRKIWSSRKNLHFFHLHFSFSFSNVLKISKALFSSTQNHLFNEILLLIIRFFLQEQLTKMYGLPIFLNKV